MWPTFRQSILNTVENIQAMHQPYAGISRNLGIVAVILGTFIGIVAFIIITYLTEVMSVLENSGTLTTNAFTHGLSLGALIMIISSSLIAIHLYKGSLPTDGLTFTQGIPSPANKMLYAGIAVMLIIFTLSVITELISITGPYTVTERTYNSALAFKWLQTLFANLLQAATAVVVIFVYIKGTGHSYSSNYKPAIVTAAIMLFFWIKILQIIIYLVNSVIAIPLGALFPIESLVTLLSGGVTIIVYIFGMIPAAAMAASVIQPENDIQFEGETETQL